jgi:hypothetical protein
MAWRKANIKFNGGEAVGGFNESDSRAVIAYTEEVKAGDSILVDGKSFKVAHAVNVGNRDETVDMLLSADAPKSPKAKKVVVKTEGETPQE